MLFNDDFTCVCRKELEACTDAAVRKLFCLLGLEYAQTGAKAPPFGECFRALGLQVDLGQCHNRVVSVGHTSERKEELAQSLRHILETRSLTSKQAEQLRGRMIFFESYAFGRTANFAVKALGMRAESASGDCGLDAHLELCLRLLISPVETAGPLVISPECTANLFVFTDGAFENGRGSVGGILYDSQGCALEFFCLEISRDVMDLFRARSEVRGTIMCASVFP